MQPKAAKANVRPSDRLRNELNRLNRTEGMSWRKIAALDKFKGVAPGTLCAVAGGYEPKTNKLRNKLNLGIVAPPKKCCKICSEPFIPNVPSRTKCYYCSPLGRYSKKKQGEHDGQGNTKVTTPSTQEAKAQKIAAQERGGLEGSPKEG